MPTRIARLLPLAAAMLITAAVYAPGLRGPLLLDDYEFFASVPLLYMDRLEWRQVRDALLSGEKRVPERPLARLSLALNHYAAGGRFDTRQLKLTNLLVHLGNGLLVYLLARIMVARAPRAAGGARDRGLLRHAPLLVAAVWLLHPIQLSSVLYVSQRCTSLAAACVLLGLLLFAAGRARLSRQPARALALMACGVAGGAALGYQFKENTVLLPLFAVLLDHYFFSGDPADRRLRRRALLFHGVVFAVLAGIAAAILVHDPDFITAPYAGRAFTPGERLLSEPRALLLYAWLLLAPFSRSFGLYQDDFTMSTGLLHPWTTLPAVALVALLAGAALWTLRARRVWGFGLLWFFAGHALESTFIGLEPVFVHRNYLPSLGVVFALVYCLAAWAPARDAWRGPARAGVVALLALALAANAWATHRRAAAWSSAASVLQTSLAGHPRSGRAHAAYAEYLARSGADARAAFEQWRQAARLDPADVGSLLHMRSIIAGGRRSLRLDPGSGARGMGPVPPRSLWSAPLVADLAYLRDLDARIAGEIERRLRDAPITAATGGALRLLAQCRLRQRDPCAAGAATARRWIDVALANPRKGAATRRQLRFALATLHRAAGATRAAVAAQKGALTGMGGLGAVYRRIQLAELYLDAGQRSRAEATLRALRGAARRSAKLGVLAQRVWNRLRAGDSARPAAPPR